MYTTSMQLPLGMSSSPPTVGGSCQPTVHEYPTHRRNHTSVTSIPIFVRRRVNGNDVFVRRDIVSPPAVPTTMPSSSSSSSSASSETSLSSPPIPSMVSTPSSSDDTQNPPPSSATLASANDHCTCAHASSHCSATSTMKTSTPSFGGHVTQDMFHTIQAAVRKRSILHTPHSSEPIADDGIPLLARDPVPVRSECSHESSQLLDREFCKHAPLGSQPNNAKPHHYCRSASVRATELVKLLAFDVPACIARTLKAHHIATFDAGHYETCKQEMHSISHERARARHIRLNRRCCECLLPRFFSTESPPLELLNGTYVHTEDDGTDADVPLVGNNFEVFTLTAAPTMGIVEYMKRMGNCLYTSHTAYIYAMVYITRITSAHPYIAINHFTYHRLILGAVIVASKFVDSTYDHPSTFAKVGGVSVHELLELEFTVFSLLNMQCGVDAELLLSIVGKLTSLSKLLTTTRGADTLAADDDGLCKKAAAQPLLVPVIVPEPRISRRRGALAEGDSSLLGGGDSVNKAYSNRSKLLPVPLPMPVNTHSTMSTPEKTSSLGKRHSLSLLDLTRCSNTVE